MTNPQQDDPVQHGQKRYHLPSCNVHLYKRPVSRCDCGLNRLITHEAVRMTHESLNNVLQFVESESGKSGRKAIIGFIKSEQRLADLVKGTTE